jgi:hypothetical protein
VDAERRAEAGELLGLQRLYVCTTLSSQPRGALSKPPEVALPPCTSRNTLSRAVMFPFCLDGLHPTQLFGTLVMLSESLSEWKCCDVVASHHPPAMDVVTVIRWRVLTSACRE